jgi:hypothetical protein
MFLWIKNKIIFPANPYLGLYSYYRLYRFANVMMYFVFTHFFIQIKSLCVPAVNEV